MLVVVLSLLATVASAADVDGDGCEDALHDSNGACVASTATLESGATIGASAIVKEQTVIGTDTAVGSSTFIGSRSTLVGRVSLSGARSVGAGTVIGRQVFIAADHSIGTDNTFGRGAEVGERIQTAPHVTIGAGTTVGDDVILRSGVYVGNLADIGDKTSVESGAVLGRGVTVLDSTVAGSIDGTVGPFVQVGADSSLASTSRIRKRATLGDGVTVLDNARIARDAIIGDNVTIGANARVGAGAEVTANTVVGAGVVVARGETLDDPVNVSQHNTISWTPTVIANGNSYQNTHQIRYENIGTMTWKACMSAASERGGSVSSNVYTTSGGTSDGRYGWAGHRKDGNAMWAHWSTYQQAGINTTRACVVARDPRSSGITATLTSTRTYDGDVWVYQDYGWRYYDECILLASNAGASIITPYTVGLSGDTYWVPSVHTANTYEWIVGGGTSYTHNSVGGGVRSPSRLCMVGYLSVPAP